MNSTNPSIAVDKSAYQGAETRFCESVYKNDAEQRDPWMADCNKRAEDYNKYVEDMLHADSIYSRVVEEMVDEDENCDSCSVDFDEDTSRDEEIKYTLREYCEGPIELWDSMSYVVKPRKLVDAYMAAIVGLLALDSETQVCELSTAAVRAYYAALRILETRVVDFNTWRNGNRPSRKDDDMSVSTTHGVEGNGSAGRPQSVYDCEFTDELVETTTVLRRERVFGSAVTQNGRIVVSIGGERRFVTVEQAKAMAVQLTKRIREAESFGAHRFASSDTACATCSTASHR